MRASDFWTLKSYCTILPPRATVTHRGIVGETGRRRQDLLSSTASALGYLSRVIYHVVLFFGNPNVRPTQSLSPILHLERNFAAWEIYRRLWPLLNTLALPPLLHLATTLSTKDVTFIHA
jgi:hypothetical protein